MSSSAASSAATALASQDAAILGPSGTVNSVKLVYHLNLFLVAVLAFCFLLTLPRAFARFTRGPEWTHGYMLHSVILAPTARPKQVRKSSRDDASEAEIEFGTDDTHTLFSHHSTAVTHVSKEKEDILVYPPHIAAWPVFMRRLALLLRRRVSPGHSIGHVLILTGYFFTLCYASFYKSNPFEDELRTGYVAMSQIPVVFAFAAKNNAVGFILGLGYEKLNFFHRFAGRLLVLAANVHSIGYFYKFAAAGDFISLLVNRSHAAAIVALLCLDFLFIFSTSFWRNKAYNIFLRSHVLCICILLPTVCLHKTALIPYVMASIVLYAADRVLRVLKTRVCEARIRPLPELGVTRVEVHSLNSGWRAGQHVRLRVLSSGMGWFGWAENHPFTIASAADGQEGLVLLCKKAGGWTNKLYEIAKVAGYGEGGIGTGRKVKVVIEGPYGGPGHTVFASYSAAVFVVGGSGITFALSAIQDLIQKDLAGASRVKVMELIWSIPDPSSLTPLIPLFSSLIQQSAFVPLKITVCYTRAQPGGGPGFTKDVVLPGLSLTAGRPRIGKILDSVIARATCLGYGPKDSEEITGIIVGVCGPVGLGDEVVEVVRQVDPQKRDTIGGVEIHEEVFGW